MVHYIPITILELYASYNMTSTYVKQKLSEVKEKIDKSISHSIHSIKINYVLENVNIKW